MIATLFLIAQVIGTVPFDSPVGESLGGRGISENGLVLQLGTGAVLRSIESKLRDTVSVKDFGAACNGVTNDSAAFTSAVTYVNSLGGGTIMVPSATCMLNITIAFGVNNVSIIGTGRQGATVLRPFDNTQPVITLDSTLGSVQGVQISDLQFVETTGGTSDAIKWVGVNPNDFHVIQRVQITGPGGNNTGFNRGINITGRMIWCRFIDVEVSYSKLNALEINTSAAVNENEFQSVRFASSQGFGVFINRTGGDVFHVLHFTQMDVELNCLNLATIDCSGFFAQNISESGIYDSYFEANASGMLDGLGADIRLAGTFARAFNIKGNLIWDTVTPVRKYAIFWNATQSSGEISGNFINAVTETIHIETSHALSHVIIGQNFEPAGSIHNLVVDVNGNTHTAVQPGGLEYNTETAAPSTVSQKSMLRFTNSGAISVNTLTGGDVGQTIYVFAAGTGSVRLVHGAGSAGQMTFPTGGDMVLAAGSSIMMSYDASGTTWRPMNFPAPQIMRFTPTYSASIFVDAAKGKLNVITATNGTAFTINTPVDQGTNQELCVQIRNTSGGALGVITWPTNFKMSAWTNPANTTSRTICTVYDGTNWIQVNQTGVDIPN